MAGTLLLVVAVLAGWADRTLFDSGEFADRAVVVLHDGRVRQELGAAFADQLEAAGVSDVVAFRSDLLPIIVDVVGTPGFEAIFRRAVETAHRAAVSQHAGTAVLELGETIEIFASSAASGDPGSAQTLERRTGSLLIDAGPVLARLDFYRLSERVRLARRGTIRARWRPGVPLPFGRVVELVEQLSVLPGLATQWRTPASTAGSCGSVPSSRGTRRVSRPRTARRPWCPTRQWLRG